MAVVVVLGSAGIVYSRDQRQPDNTRPLAAAAGRAGDHWHAAIGFDICGAFAPSPPDTGQDPLGVHSHGDGVVHIHPFSAQSAGRRAVLGIFFDSTSLKVTSSKIQVPGTEARNNGDKCGDKTAQVRTKVWDSRNPSDQGRIVTGNPRDIRPTNGMLITVAFEPDGVDIPRPPSAGQLDKLTDVDPPGSTTTTLPGSSTTVAGDVGATTTPSSTTAPSTTVPSSTVPSSTVAPSTTSAP